MRKLRVSFFILFVCSGLLLGAQKVNASQSVALFTSGSQLQNIELFDDLDPRDNTNQPIQTKKAKDGLTAIFQSGLFNLLMAREIYSTAEVLSSLSKSLNLAAQNITRNLPSTVSNLMAVFFSTIKQLQKILICLSMLFGVSFVVLRFSVSNFQFSMPSICSSFAVLRC